MGKYAILAGIAVLLLLVVGYFLMSLSYKRKENNLRQLVLAKKKDNENQFDNVWKKISQVAEVTDGQKEALKEIIIGYAKARGEGGGSLSKSIREAVPNVDTSTFNNLQNIIVSSRDGFTRNQTELVDLKRAHDLLLTDPISGFFLSDKQPIEITIVTSSRTGKAFETGKDDDTSVFKRPQAPAPAEK